jgi:16S rRNA (adenine1518-N6/adenine1519-N6)-dimethyltransferase
VTLPKARKRFGQNFLTDEYVVNRIINLISPQPDEYILEVGPGARALTDHLVSARSKVTAVEVDRDLYAKIKSHYSGCDNFLISNEDILNYDIEKLAINSKDWKIVGNLPYNIATPLIIKLLGYQGVWSEMVFMLQKEVAERFTAICGTKAYGRLSIMAQRRASIECHFEVDKNSFAPIPKVQSAVVRFVKKEYVVLPALEKHMEDIVRTAFSTRRKTIANSLRKIFNVDSLIKAEIDPKDRAENIPIASYEALAEIKLLQDNTLQ